MTQKPQRARPAGRSTLVPSVEPINTGSTQSPANQPTPPSPKLPQPQGGASNTKNPSTTVSLKMDDDLIAQAKTAVLSTAGIEGGYKSFAALIQSAVTRELQRLADEFNDGTPFEKHEGEFRRGRPLK